MLNPATLGNHFLQIHAARRRAARPWLLGTPAPPGLNPWRAGRRGAWFRLCGYAAMGKVENFPRGPLSRGCPGVPGQGTLIHIHKLIIK